MSVPNKVVLVLSHDEAETLRSVFGSAERGREDFNYLAGLDQGDYEPEDIAAAREDHAAETALEARLRLTIEKQTNPATAGDSPMPTSEEFFESVGRKAFADGEGRTPANNTVVQETIVTLAQTAEVVADPQTLSREVTTVLESFQRGWDEAKVIAKETEYKVTWATDVDAGSHREAAEEALASIMREGSIAHVFEVQGPDGFIEVVDLDD